MTETPRRQPTRKRLAGQGALLFAGFGAAQAFSFLRNAMIGHALSKGDFGIAAAITLVLQMIETLSDLGADRLIVQAPDGDHPRFLAAAHLLLVGRGLLLALFLVASGPLLAGFFDAPHAATAFQLAALAPAIKGFLHLDIRLAQRNFDNRPQLIVDALPQAIAFALTLPVLMLTRDYTAVVSLALLQAALAVGLSHALAFRPYRLLFDTAMLKRQIAFGWPILVSALPLVAVYQGDRIIIAHYAGIEALASYTAAFMITMVPGLIAAKVGHALMLPLFSDALRARKNLAARFKISSEAITVLAALYLTTFIVAGNAVLPIAFGANYTGLGAVTAWLAAMWSVRMLQAVPGMALMAHGETRPFISSGIIRAAALPLAAVAAHQGANLATIAAIGLAFETGSLVYIAWRIDRLQSGLGPAFLLRASYLLPVGLTASLAASAAPDNASGMIAALLLTLLAVAASGLALMPGLNILARRTLQERNLLSAHG